MSLLGELNDLVENIGIPVETGVFTGTAPDEYLVLTPLADSFALHADNRPQYDVQEARISLYTKSSYAERKNQITCALLAADIGITDRRFISHEDDTGYFHYAIDVAKSYEMEE
ncbi:MAG: hypothetical protein K2O45_16805 [Oscillospiraceae bacterium]|nr:hypothetical protein [Oscillospiraceae bacterium]